jgi:hypothetical protein
MKGSKSIRSIGFVWMTKASQDEDVIVIEDCIELARLMLT